MIKDPYSTNIIRVIRSRRKKMVVSVTLMGDRRDLHRVWVRISEVQTTSKA